VAAAGTVWARTLTKTASSALETNTLRLISAAEDRGFIILILFGGVV
jgi:hypothetical protein